MAEKRWRGWRWSGGKRERMQHAGEGEARGEGGEPWSATQSRSHRGEEGLLVQRCARVFLTGKTAHKVEQEG